MHLYWSNINLKIDISYSLPLPYEQDVTIKLALELPQFVMEIFVTL